MFKQPYLLLLILLAMSCQEDDKNMNSSRNTQKQKPEVFESYRTEKGRGFVHSFYDGIAIIDGNDNGYGYIDTNGQLITEMKYDLVLNWECERGAVLLNDLWGYVDRSGQEIIPLQYESVWTFSENLASVSQEGKYGFINENGVVIIPFLYDQAWNFSNGLVGVKLNQSWKFIDTNGHQAIETLYDDVLQNFVNDTAHVELNGKTFYINTKGECVKGCN